MKSPRVRLRCAACKDFRLSCVRLRAVGLIITVALDAPVSGNQGEIIWCPPPPLVTMVNNAEEASPPSDPGDRNKPGDERGGASLFCSVSECADAVSVGVCVANREANAKPRTVESAGHGEDKESDRSKQCCNEKCSKLGAIVGGVCALHGAKQNTARCSYDGCTNQARRSGRCYRHVAGVHEGRLHKGAKGWMKRAMKAYKRGTKVDKRCCSHEGCMGWYARNGVCALDIEAEIKMGCCAYEESAKLAREGGLGDLHNKKQEDYKAKICVYGYPVIRIKKKGHAKANEASVCIEAQVGKTESCINEDSANERKKGSHQVNEAGVCAEALVEKTESCIYENSINERKKGCVQVDEKDTSHCQYCRTDLKRNFLAASSGAHVDRTTESCINKTENSFYEDSADGAKKASVEMDEEESDEELGDEIYQWIQNGKLATEEKNKETSSSSSSGLHLSRPCNKLDMQNNNACSEGGESQLVWRAKNALFCMDRNTERAQLCPGSSDDITNGTVVALLQKQRDLIQLLFLQRFSDATR